MANSRCHTEWQCRIRHDENVRAFRTVFQENQTVADLNKQLQADLNDMILDIERLRKERDFLVDRINRALDLDGSAKQHMIPQIRNLLSRAIGAVEKGQV